MTIVTVKSIEQMSGDACVDELKAKDPALALLLNRVPDPTSREKLARMCLRLTVQLDMALDRLRVDGEVVPLDTDDAGNNWEVSFRGLAADMLRLADEYSGWSSGAWPELIRETVAQHGIATRNEE